MCVSWEGGVSYRKMIKEQTLKISLLLLDVQPTTCDSISASEKLRKI